MGEEEKETFTLLGAHLKKDTMRMQGRWGGKALQLQHGRGARKALRQQQQCTPRGKKEEKCPPKPLAGRKLQLS